MKINLIAPCGMDCGICMAYLRERNHCPGCRFPDRRCGNCTIWSCKNLRGKYCFSCSTFPCRRLQQLDKRYRTKYGMSMITNLEAIRAHGIRKFVAGEKECWICSACGGTINVHRHCCSTCGATVARRDYSPG